MVFNPESQLYGRIHHGVQDTLYNNPSLIRRLQFLTLQGCCLSYEDIGTIGAFGENLRVLNLARTAVHLCSLFCLVREVCPRNKIKSRRYGA